MLISITDKHLRTSQNLVNLDYRCVILRAAGIYIYIYIYIHIYIYIYIYASNANSSVKCAAMSEVY